MRSPGIPALHGNGGNEFVRRVSYTPNEGSMREGIHGYDHELFFDDTVIDS
jgi:hypothetical protein